MKKINLIFIAILRFFKNNITSLIGFMLLVFFSIGIFTTLNSTTNSLRQSYKSIVQNGLLHDYVVNESYEVGNSNFEIEDIKNIGQNNWSYELNIGSSSKWTGGDEKIYEKITEFINESDKPEFYNSYLLNNEKYFFYFYNDSDRKFEQETPLQKNHYADLNLESYYHANDKDQAEAIIKSAVLNNIENKIDQICRSSIGELFKYDINKENPNIELREFNSLDISSNKQNIYYKMINTQDNENIDKLVLQTGSNLSREYTEKFGTMMSYIHNIYKINGDKVKEWKPSNLDKFYPFKDNIKWNDQDKFIAYSWRILNYYSLSDWSGNDPKQDDLNKLNLYINDQNLSVYQCVNPWNINKPYKPNKPLPLDPSGIFISSINETQKYLTSTDDHLISTSDFKITFNYNASLPPKIGYYENKISYESIVSPWYFKYSGVGKKPIPINEWNEHKKLNQKDFEEYFKNLDSKYKISIDNQDFAILGSGISPDFMYPIVNNNRQIPDRKNEEIVYLPNSGYKKIFDAFRASPIEKFLVGRSIDRKNISEQINEINDLAKYYMQINHDKKAAYAKDDLNNIYTPATARVVFIPNMIHSITVISVSLTAFFSTLTLIVVAIMIKRFIDINKEDLSILLAYGYSKIQIVIALGLSILLFTSLAAVAGIFMGMILQLPALSLFSGFWTLPVSAAKLTFALFFEVFSIAIVFFTFLTIIFSFSSLKGDVIDLMQKKSEINLGRISIKIKKMFKNKDILTIFKVTLALSSPIKIISLGIMSAIVMSSLSFGLSSIGKFKYAMNKTFESKKYKNEIELYTPTDAGGLYYSVPLNKPSATIFTGFYNYKYDLKNFNDEMIKFNKIAWDIGDNNRIPSTQQMMSKYNDYIKNYNAWVQNKYFSFGSLSIAKDNSDVYRNTYQQREVDQDNYSDNQLYLNQGLQLPSVSDVIDSKYGLEYLQYTSGTKIALNTSILGFDPWNLISKLMPSNYLNYFNQNYKQLLENAFRSNDKYDYGNISHASTTFPSISFASAMGNPYNYINTNTVPLLTVKVKNNSDLIDDDKCFSLTYIDKNNNIKNFYTDNNISDLNNLKLERDTQHPYKAKGYLSSDALSFRVSEEIINFILGIENNIHLNSMNYTINYKKIPLSKNDETFTYVLANPNKKNGQEFTTAKPFNITGIKNDSTHVSLYSGSKNIKDLISGETISNKYGDESKEIPLIANLYAKRMHNLKIGDDIKMNITNRVDRFTSNSDSNYTFKIVGFNDTYQGEEYFISQENANQITGIKDLQDIKESQYGWFVFPENVKKDLNNGKLKKEWTYGFNGFFSDDDNIPQIKSNISLYSPFGLYTGYDKPSSLAFISALSKDSGGNDPGSNKETNFYKALEITKMKDNAKYKIWYENEKNKPVDAKTKNLIDQFSSDLKNIYGDSMYVSTLSTVVPISVLSNIFKNIENLSRTLEWIILVVINICSVIIILLITLIIVSDSMGLSGILKSLGLRSLTNASSFIVVYLPVILIATILAIPLSALFNYFYSLIIFNKIGILISAQTPWYIFFSSIGIMMLIFSFSILLTWRKIKKRKLTETIK
ncbi:MAG: ABC transporter permease [Mycoplasmoidaceae bacterium]